MKWLSLGSCNFFVNVYTPNNFHQTAVCFPKLYFIFLYTVINIWMIHILTKRLQPMHSESNPMPNHSHCRNKDYESGIKLVLNLMSIKGSVSSLNISCLCVTISLIYTTQWFYLWRFETSFALWPTSCKGQTSVTLHNNEHCIIVTSERLYSSHSLFQRHWFHTSATFYVSSSESHQWNKAYLSWSVVRFLSRWRPYLLPLSPVSDDWSSDYNWQTYYRKFISQWLPATEWNLMLRFTFQSKSE